jgi:hypothetical protein
LKEVLKRCKLTDGHLLGITTDHASSYYLMTLDRQSTLEASGIEWPALQYNIPCMAHVIQLALGSFMCSFRVNGQTNSWAEHECDRQFGEDESTDIGKSERLCKEDNARINKVLAMKPGIENIIENVRR